MTTVKNWIDVTSRSIALKDWETFRYQMTDLVITISIGIMTCCCVLAVAFILFEIAINLNLFAYIIIGSVLLFCLVSFFILKVYGKKLIEKQKFSVIAHSFNNSDKKLIQKEK